MFKALLMSILLITPISLLAHIDSEHDARTEITGAQLKSWYDKNKPIIVIDARTKAFFDGKTLPHAKWIPHDSPEEEIFSMLPSKDSTIVVYCSGPECPASGWLYDRLNYLGFKNVYEYSTGIKDWIRRGYPIARVQLKAKDVLDFN